MLSYDNLFNNTNKNKIFKFERVNLIHIYQISNSKFYLLYDIQSQSANAQFRRIVIPRLMCVL